MSAHIFHSRSPQFLSNQPSRGFKEATHWFFLSNTLQDYSLFFIVSFQFPSQTKMAQTATSILLSKRISHSFKIPNRAAIFLLLHHSKNFTLKPYSTSASPEPPPPSSSSSSLSARMSFIFDQIDAIERERSQKDETLQRIRAWRQSKNAAEQQRQNVDEESLGSQNEGFGAEDFGDSPVNLAAGNSVEVKGRNEVELVHPWPEWIDLMQRLVQQNYFDHRRVNEDKLVENLGIDGLDTVVNSSDAGIDFKDYRTVQTACVNFGKDRFDIFRKLSRKDIQILVGYGCPSADKKVVFSSKLLRKHAHLDEGDVCSNCSLRSSCERAYLVTNKEDEARTIDVMRVLLAYGFDPINETVTNKTLPKQKTLKTIVRKLLHEIVKLSAVPRDPNLPPPVIKRPPPKVKQPPPTPKRRVGRDDVEMKKGDWVCPKCDFMNFAKNTVCLQCDAKRPKRQLLPGEWECPQCNFLNYRRNMACFHCDCKRPPEEFNENQMEQRQPISKTRFEKITDRSEVSNAWNFDFDDNESDGADVAAFEYADPARTDNDPLGPPAEGVNFRGPDDFNRASRNPMAHERHGTGFDDFADEDDDLDSYELDTGNNRSTFSNNSSRQEISEWEDGGDYNDDFRASTRNLKPYSKPSKSKHKSASFSGSDDDELGFDSDDEYSKRPNWKSSHVADSGSRIKGRGQTGRSRGLTFGSDEDIDLDSDADDDDFGSGRRKGNKRSSGGRSYKRSSDFEDDSFSGFGSEDDEVSSRGNRFGRKKMEGGGRRTGFRDRGDYDSGRNARGRSKGKMGNRNNSWNDEFESRSPSRGPRDNGRRFQGNDRGMNDRGGKSGNFRGGKRGFDDRRQPKSRDYHDADPSEFRNSRRVIER